MAKTRRRLRSSTVILGGMGVVAAALTSCGSEPDQRCVDRYDYDPGEGYGIIDDRYCESGPDGVSSGGAYYSSWYYGGRSDGRTASGGTFSHSEAVDRGGLGCSASGSGGG